MRSLRDVSTEVFGAFNGATERPSKCAVYGRVFKRLRVLSIHDLLSRAT